MAQFPQALRLCSLFFSLSLSLSPCLSTVQAEAGGDGSSLAAIINPLCFYYWREALEMFIAPSLFYQRDEQADIFTIVGEPEGEQKKKKQHIYQQVKVKN